jgi:hypothetical protein
VSEEENGRHLQRFLNAGHLDKKRLDLDNMKRDMEFIKFGLKI